MGLGPHTFSLSSWADPRRAGLAGLSVPHACPGSGRESAGWQPLPGGRPSVKGEGGRAPAAGETEVRSLWLSPLQTEAWGEARLCRRQKMSDHVPPMAGLIIGSLSRRRELEGPSEGWAHRMPPGSVVSLSWALFNH